MADALGLQVQSRFVPRPTDPVPEIIRSFVQRQWVKFARPTGFRRVRVGSCRKLRVGGTCTLRCVLGGTAARPTSRACLQCAAGPPNPSLEPTRTGMALGPLPGQPSSVRGPKLPSRRSRLSSNVRLQEPPRGHSGTMFKLRSSPPQFGDQEALVSCQQPAESTWRRLTHNISASRGHVSLDAEHCRVPRSSIAKADSRSVQHQIRHRCEFQLSSSSEGRLPAGTGDIEANHRRLRHGARLSRSLESGPPPWKAGPRSAQPSGFGQAAVAAQRSHGNPASLGARRHRASAVQCVTKRAHRQCHKHTRR